MIQVEQTVEKGKEYRELKLGWDKVKFTDVAVARSGVIMLDHFTDSETRGGSTSLYSPYLPVSSSPVMPAYVKTTTGKGFVFDNGEKFSVS